VRIPCAAQAPQEVYSVIVPHDRSRRLLESGGAVMAERCIYTQKTHKCVFAFLGAAEISSERA